MLNCKSIFYGNIDKIIYTTLVSNYCNNKFIYLI